MNDAGSQATSLGDPRRYPGRRAPGRRARRGVGPRIQVQSSSALCVSCESVSPSSAASRASLRCSSSPTCRLADVLRDRLRDGPCTLAVDSLTRIDAVRKSRARCCAGGYLTVTAMSPQCRSGGGARRHDRGRPGRLLLERTPAGASTRRSKQVLFSIGLIFVSVAIAYLRPLRPTLPAWLTGRVDVGIGCFHRVFLVAVARCSRSRSGGIELPRLALLYARPSITAGWRVCRHQREPGVFTVLGLGTRWRRSAEPRC